MVRASVGARTVSIDMVFPTNVVFGFSLSTLRTTTGEMTASIDLSLFFNFLASELRSFLPSPIATGEMIGSVDLILPFPESVACPLIPFP